MACCRQPPTLRRSSRPHWSALKKNGRSTCSAERCFCWLSSTSATAGISRCRWCGDTPSRGNKFRQVHRPATPLLPCSRQLRIFAAGWGQSIMLQLQSALGVVALLAIAWAVGENRRGVAWKNVGASLLVTLATAVLLLKIPQIKTVFAAVNGAVDAVAGATQAGTSFVFGYIGGGTL